MFNMLRKLKSLFGSSDAYPRFLPPEERPYCSVYLVNSDILLFEGFHCHSATSNRYIARLDIPSTDEQVSNQIFNALVSADTPTSPGPAGTPPYYVTAAGLTDERKFHKAASMIGVSWIKKPHCVVKDPANWVQGSTLWAPGIYLNPMRRLRRTGAFEGLGLDYNRGPIPPEDHERIGRELLELFDLIRTDFDAGPRPKRA